MEGLKSAEDLPYTISYAINYRSRINSFQEFPKDKRPPRNLWDKPHKLERFMEEVWSTDGKGKDKEFVDFNYDEVE